MAGAYLTLDDFALLQAVWADPDAFLDTPEPLTIDEAQRAPELFLAVKRAVDRDLRPGRFVLSGSADLSLLRGESESLAGRALYLTLRPFSARELRRCTSEPPFLPAFFGEPRLHAGAAAEPIRPTEVLAGGAASRGDRPSARWRALVSGLRPDLPRAERPGPTRGRLRRRGRPRLPRHRSEGSGPLDRQGPRRTEGLPRGHAAVPCDSARLRRRSGRQDRRAALGIAPRTAPESSALDSSAPAPSGGWVAGRPYSRGGSGVGGADSPSSCRISASETPTSRSTFRYSSLTCSKNCVKTMRCSS
jgi:hypothetical protein